MERKKISKILPVWIVFVFVFLNISSVFASDNIIDGLEIVNLDKIEHKKYEKPNWIIEYKAIGKIYKDKEYVTLILENNNAVDVSNNKEFKNYADGEYVYYKYINKNSSKTTEYFYSLKKMEGNEQIIDHIDKNDVFNYLLENNVVVKENNNDDKKILTISTPISFFERNYYYFEGYPLNLTKDSFVNYHGENVFLTYTIDDSEEGLKLGTNQKVYYNTFLNSFMLEKLSYKEMKTCKIIDPEEIIIKIISVLVLATFLIIIMLILLPIL